VLHGRRAECARIDHLLAEARELHSGALIVRGEAGVGKTALLTYAGDHAGDMPVLRSAGVEAESEFPFAALHQLVRPVLDRVGTLPTRQAAALGAAFGTAERVGEDRFLVSVALLTLLAEVAEKRGLLCLVDDAQWLDRASADALVFTARRLEAEGVVLLMAARDDALRGFGAPGLAELRLRGLDDESADALLVEQSPVEMDHKVRNQLRASAAGNPLALVELPQALSEAQLAGRQPLPEPLPIGAAMERIFLERTRRLPAATQTLLLVAAAEDTGELGIVLRGAQQLGAVELDLDPAETANLVVVTAQRLSFRHPLVRSAIYQSATFTQRRAAHQALAAVLDGEAEADRRAWHLAAAATTPDAAVADELERAAERAAHRGGHAAAAAALERAAELTAPVPPRVRRLLSAAEAAWLAGLSEHARALVERAAQLPSPPRLGADLEHLRGSIELGSGTPANAAAVLVAGSELVRQLDPQKAASMLTDASLAAWMEGDFGRAAETRRRLATLLPANPTAAVAAHLYVGLSELVQGDLSEAEPLLRDVTALAEASKEPHWLFVAGAAAMFLGDDARALALLTQAVRRARAQGAVGALPSVLAPLATLQMWSGRYGGAMADATEGLRLAEETGQANFAAHHRAVLAWVAAIQGDEEACRTAATAALSHALARGLGPAAAIAGWALGLLDLGAGRPGQAVQRLEAMMAAGPGESHPMSKVFAAPDLVEAAVRSGREPQARMALARFEAWARPTRTNWGLAVVARCHGLLTDGPEADGHFQHALALHTTSGRAFDAARTGLLYGEALRRRRRRAEARRHLRAALEAFERLGAAPWAERARTELRASGETARKRDPSTIGQLTPQELQIARFVGQGATNREIAAQLFLSPRTVDHHLRNVFVKLGISSRAELIRLPDLDGSAHASR
jgi:DNA-binding CsgD family transcriptional regulator